VPESRSRQILGLGVPITAAMLSQSLLTLVDTAMVAALDDASALAGVGIGGYASYLAVAFVLGLSVGVQTVVARCIGEEQPRTAFMALNSGLLLAGVGGLLLCGVCYYFAPLLALISDDPAVGEVGVEYFIWRALSIAPIAINFTYRGYWTGIRKVNIFIRTMLLIQVANFGFSYCLIFGEFGFPELGAPGSGLGTTLAVALGTVVHSLVTRFSKHGELLFRALPPADVSRRILQLSWPNGLQQVFVASGMMVYFALLARIDVAAMAIGHAIINISLFIILPGSGLGMAATTLVSQALGRKDPQDAYRWGWDTVRLTAILMALLGLPLWLFPHPILSLFLPAELVESAIVPLRITGMSAVLQAVSMVVGQSLLGAGRSREVMLYSFALQWLWGLPMAAFVGIYLGYGLIGVWWMQLVERIIAALLYTTLWRRKHWMHQPT
jgi:putative MATE family efflux protein